MTKAEVLSGLRKKMRACGWQFDASTKEKNAELALWLFRLLDRFAYEVAIECVPHERDSDSHVVEAMHDQGWNACRDQFLANIKEKTNQV